MSKAAGFSDSFCSSRTTFFVMPDSSQCLEIPALLTATLQLGPTHHGTNYFTLPACFEWWTRLCTHQRPSGSLTFTSTITARKGKRTDPGVSKHTGEIVEGGTKINKRENKYQRYTGAELWFQVETNCF